jgi:hypothetical protein
MQTAVADMREVQHRLKRRSTRVIAPHVPRRA